MCEAPPFPGSTHVAPGGCNVTKWTWEDSYNFCSAATHLLVKQPQRIRAWALRSPEFAECTGFLALVPRSPRRRSTSLLGAGAVVFARVIPCFCSRAITRAFLSDAST